MAANQRKPQFITLDIACGSKAVFIPTDVVGIEEISSVGVWTMQAAVSVPSLPDDSYTTIIDQLIGATASLHIDYGADQDLMRHVHGLITMAEWLGTDAQVGTGLNQDRFHRYRLELQPDIALLGLTTRSRVIQKQSAAKIAEDLIRKHSPTLQVSFSADGLKGEDKPELDYVVQYQETDLAFMTRVLAESGLYWTTIHDAKRCTVVLGSGPNNFTDLLAGGDKRVVNHAPAAGLKAQPDGGRVEAIVLAAPRRRMITGSVELRRYDHEQPDAPQFATARADKPPTLAPVGQSYLPGHRLPEPDRAARAHQERLAGQVRTLTGRSDVRALQPGTVIRYCSEKDDQQLTQAADGDSGVTAVAILSIRHEATQKAESASQSMGAATYRNDFTAIPANAAWRLPLPPRPVIPGFITARIDGSSKDQLATAPVDDQGRYNVKLFLDREPTDAGKGSLPVRMAQPYAGPPTARNDPAGFHAPLHIGTEVVLAHLDGDPDRPIIAGAVPHGTYPTPAAQGNADHTAWRSVGANEIVLDDSKGHERLRMVAERDHQTFVYHDEVRQIGNSQTTWIGFPVAKQNPGGPAANPLESGVSNTHSAASPPGAGFGKTEFVMLGSALVVGGFYQIAVVGAMNTTVGLSKTEQVGAFHHSTTLGYRKIEVGKDFTVSVKGEYSEITEKDRKIETKKNLIIDAAETITLRVGKSKITMNKDGEIVIDGKELNIKTTADTVIKAKNVKTN